MYFSNVKFEDVTDRDIEKRAEELKKETPKVSLPVLQEVVEDEGISL